MSIDVVQLNAKASQEAAALQALRSEIGKVIIGQDSLVNRLLIALITNQHVLLEGVPGLAKTLTVTTLAQAIQATFHRIQFTPDLLPDDLIGTLVYNPKSGDFTTKQGPVFANIILADEINRAPAKVQSALLEAMQERHVTIGDNTFPLPAPFLVLATQNPVEQEGTYPLPEAQVDRFMFKVVVDYPSTSDELQILRRHGSARQNASVQKIMTPDDIARIRDVLDSIFMDAKIEEYIVNLVDATRHPENYHLNDLKPLIHFGASPRATIFLALAAKGQALLAGRGYTTPQDVKSIAMDVLRHRILLTYEAEAQEITAENVVKQLLDAVPVP
ncbi:MAG: MoxR family ATPase [Lentisphaeria bacterium]|nr:MoxR family ATPase [Lentisphaeria bacterium]